VPPAFLVSGRIAIEVRRLNQNVSSESGKAIGIEKTQFDLLNCIRPILPSLDVPGLAQSWFVTYSFRRPIPPLSHVRRKTREALIAFRDGHTKDRELSTFDSITLHLIPSTNSLDHSFVLGGYQDLDSGGWLVPELERNIHVCIREKAEKIAQVRPKYDEWWLVLIDCIGYGARESLRKL
jgi:hypothetical protein